MSTKGEAYVMSCIRIIIFVFRDLADRNYLVGDLKKSVKISDFGMSGKDGVYVMSSMRIVYKLQLKLCKRATKN